MTDRHTSKPEAPLELSGYIIVLLSSRVGAFTTDDLRTLARIEELPELGELLDELGGPPTQPVVTSVRREQVVELEELAARRAHDDARPADRRLPQPLGSLARFWRIDVRRIDRSWDALAERFARAKDVEAAYAELTVEDPAPNAQNNPYFQDQGYLGPAPDGVDAFWAWNQTGGRGQGVRLADVEAGWALRHDDLIGRHVELIANDNRADGSHGTAVLGVVTAEDNGVGVVGIAHSLDAVYASSRYREPNPDEQDVTNDTHIADAIVAAMGVLRPGDILLIEATPNRLPAETQLAERTAIQNAVLLGIVPVEAAGNRDRNLNRWRERTRGLTPEQKRPEHLESGAILVGAGTAARVNGVHDRQEDSNYGRRVDCFAWGESITTAGGLGDLTPDEVPERDYTATFDGTSGAAAIIAGVAAVTQGMYRAANQGNHLWPEEMRAILRKRANGTTRPADVRDPIGPMPDLHLIGTKAFTAV